MDPILQKRIGRWNWPRGEAWWESLLEMSFLRRKHRTLGTNKQQERKEQRERRWEVGEGIQKQHLWRLAEFVPEATSVETTCRWPLSPPHLTPRSPLFHHPSPQSSLPSSQPTDLPPNKTQNYKKQATKTLEILWPPQNTKGTTKTKTARDTQTPENKTHHKH